MKPQLLLILGGLLLLSPLVIPDQLPGAAWHPQAGELADFCVAYGDMIERDNGVEPYIVDRDAVLGVFDMAVVLRFQEQFESTADLHGKMAAVLDQGIPQGSLNRSDIKGLYARLAEQVRTGDIMK